MPFRLRRTRSSSARRSETVVPRSMASSPEPPVTKASEPRTASAAAVGQMPLKSGEDADELIIDAGKVSSLNAPENLSIAASEKKVDPTPMEASSNQIVDDIDAIKAEESSPEDETEALDELAVSQLRETIAEVFDPSHPTRDRNAFSGRNTTVAELLAGILYRNNHAAICGPRGSGKTSLARIFADFADEYGVAVIYQSVSDGADFHDLLSPYFTQIPEECCEAGQKQRILSEMKENKLNPTTASELLSLVQYSQVVFIMDEFDRLEDPKTKSQLSTLMKMTSDARTKVHILVVGIGQNVRELVTAHASLSRHLTVAMVEPLAEAALESIANQCLEHCGLAIEQAALSGLVNAAYGSPYHLRLFGMHAALAAASRQSQTIKTNDVEAGLRAAFEEWRICNPADAFLFEQLPQSYPGDTEALVRFAEIAAVRHAGTMGYQDMPAEKEYLELSNRPFFTELRRVCTVDKATGEITFLDSIAPQFLLIAARSTAPSKVTDGASESNMEFGS